MSQLKTRIVAVTGVALVMGLLMAEPADARRRGSFGSRGARTYSAPPPTQTAPGQVAPVQRSMTTPQTPGAQAARPNAAAATPARAQQQRRGGFLGGLGGGLLGGLLVGGLIGALMGNGFGAGMAGFGAMLFQLAILALGVWLLMKLFRRRQQPATAMAGFGAMRDQAQVQPQPQPQPQPYTTSTYTPTTPAFGAGSPIEITVDAGDRREFERLLIEVQAAYAREDYAALRELTTPEIMSYLAEELSQNAVQGRRNDVTGTKLLEADVAEAWREGDAEYATAALRYESIDIFRDRQTGDVVQGDPTQPTQETELWTFVRRPGSGWKLSAIQET